LISPEARWEFLAAQAGLLFGGGDPWWVYGLDADARDMVLGTVSSMLSAPESTLVGARMNELVAFLLRSGLVVRK
jgi:hypothetical protein